MEAGFGDGDGDMPDTYAAMELDSGSGSGAAGACSDASVEWEDMLFMLVFVIIQWMKQRNEAAMTVIEAAASLPMWDPGMPVVLALSTYGVGHNLHLLHAALSAIHERGESSGRIWVLDRSGGVWKDLQRVGRRHDKIFKRFCRLPCPVFEDVLRRIAPHIQRATTNWRQPLPAEQKFACALIKWATGGFYRQSAHGLGMGLASALRSNEDVADAIIREYGDVISFPRGRRLQKTLDAFERKGFPGCVGAIDCTHLYVEKPRKERGECYYDRTGQFLVIAQVVCDHECRILDVYVSCPGSNHDSRVLRLSPLYFDAQNGLGVFSVGAHMLTEGTRIGRYVLGDAGFPCLSWLITPVPARGCTADGVTFNESHSAARSVIERTFGILKAVWQNFIRRQIGNLKTLCKEFMAMCILHNILQDHNVDVDELCASDGDDSDDDSPPPRPPPPRSPAARRRPRQTFHDSTDESYGSEEGAECRSRLVTHVVHHVRVHGAPQRAPWRRVGAQVQA
ncbi:hypothetical protein CBR_g39535 [Chara braunii]|uniref:DDE Tnp4 domain-containing protein n=1 Tax=Chara braunii TaxID=69332 RepID=A0A388LS96_CHABU|nr:hypothetical protein CBR_g39535 [Chara braunii]|eukprot:GBG85072.1 hypothetical protein CBR_g39535 [Chara braunii]